MKLAIGDTSDWSAILLTVSTKIYPNKKTKTNRTENMQANIT